MKSKKLATVLAVIAASTVMGTTAFAKYYGLASNYTVNASKSYKSEQTKVIAGTHRMYLKGPMTAGSSNSGLTVGVFTKPVPMYYNAKWCKEISYSGTATDTHKYIAGSYVKAGNYYVVVDCSMNSNYAHGTWKFETIGLYSN